MGWRLLALVALILFTVLWVAPVVLVFLLGSFPYWLATGRVPVDRLERLLSPGFMETFVKHVTAATGGSDGNDHSEA